MRPIAFDATPLGTGSSDRGHAARGIGRYVTSVLRALAEEAPDWAAAHLLPLCIDESDVPWWPSEVAVTRRPAWRAQDIGWWTAALFDRGALRGRHLAAWHGNDPNAPLGPGAPRRIMTVHDLLPLTDDRIMARMRPHRRAVYRLYLRRLRQADLVVAVSHVTARRAEQVLGLAPERIKVVYPALVATATAASPAYPIGRLPDLLFVGVPAPHKNPSAAVAALAECRRRGHDIRLRFVGPHPPRDRAHLVAAANAAGVASSILYLDRITDEHLAALYARDVLLALSSDEGLGLPPIEALLAGGRVVAGDAESYREALGGAVDYVSPQDARAIADAYERSAERALPAAPPADVVGRFSAAASAAASIAAYESLANSGR